jgi:AcrR family transcriptional regulator
LSTPAPPSDTDTAPRPTTARGARTRERLLDAAELLWGQRGLDGVSLREIRVAAGQRNSSALQFHFGGRDGLRQALAQRHLPRIATHQEQLYRALVAEGRRTDLAGLVEVLIRPVAEYVRRGPSERAWIKIAAQTLGRPDVALHSLAAEVPPVTYQVGADVLAQVSRTVEPDVALERLLSVVLACYHLAADRARLEESPPDEVARAALPFDRWLGNLLEMAIGAMTAPHQAAGVGPAGGVGPVDRMRRMGRAARRSV